MRSRFSWLFALVCVLAAGASFGYVLAQGKGDAAPKHEATPLEEAYEKHVEVAAKASAAEQVVGELTKLVEAKKAEAASLRSEATKTKAALDKLVAEGKEVKSRGGPCTRCSGSGNCVRCGGTGQRSFGDCLMCRGLGTCYTCKGTGWRVY